MIRFRLLFTGRYLIAADGARSAVRRSLGIEFEGFTYPELFLIASTDFKFESTLTDIAFDQVVVAVPEPASLATAAVVTIGLAVAQRRSIGRRGPG